jgi:hypothetical protein
MIEFALDQVHFLFLNIQEERMKQRFKIQLKIQYSTILLMKKFIHLLIETQLKKKKFFSKSMKKQLK